MGFTCCHFHTLQNNWFRRYYKRKQQKTNENKWLYILDHAYRIIIIGESVSGKTNAMINLINEQNGIAKIYLHPRDLSEPKYDYLIKKCQGVGIKHVNNSNAFIECSSTMDDVYENIHDYNPSNRRKFLIVFL